MASSNLPSRTKSDDDAMSSEDTSETTKLFNERLQAWRRACGYMEDYVGTTEKMQHAHHKEYEKVLKTISSPIKEGEHFSPSEGGVNSMLDSMRSNTQGLANSHLDTAKTIKSSILPIFERLHSEVKSKQKELTKGVGKGSKAVDKSRTATQKHIELLGQHSAAGGSGSSKPDPHTDPFILQKGVVHRLGKQISEENATRQDMLTVQSNFSQFEAHIMQSLQQGMSQFAAAVGAQADNQKALYSTMSQNIMNINPSFEWDGFVKRKNDILIDPNAPPRSLSNVTFPNQNHASTKALCQGSLERKSGVLKKWETAFYAIAPAGFLHEFKSDDMVTNDPKPATSLYLPDCTMGGLNGALFNVKGKDRSSKLPGTSSEYAFKAHSEADARQWYDIIEGVASGSASKASVMVSGSGSGSRVSSAPGSSVTSPISPTEGRSDIPPSAAAQETGTTGGGYGGMSGMDRKPGEY